MGGSHSGCGQAPTKRGHRRCSHTDTRCTRRRTRCSGEEHAGTEWREDEMRQPCSCALAVRLWLRVQSPAGGGDRPHMAVGPGHPARPRPTARADAGSRALPLGPRGALGWWPQDPAPFSRGDRAIARMYLVPACVVTLVDANDTISKMSQSVQAVGSLLQGPKSYVLVVGDPGRQRESGQRSPMGLRPGCPSTAAASQ